MKDEFEDMWGTLWKGIPFRIKIAGLSVLMIGVGFLGLVVMILIKVLQNL